jgi:predicted small metal-binding protein
MSRCIDCPCGHVLRAENDEALFTAARRHVVEHHPGMQRTDDDLRGMIRERARDEAVTIN